MGLLGCYSTVSRLVMVRLGDTEQRLTTPGQGIIISIIRVILTCFRAWAPGNESEGSKGYVMHVNAFGGGIILTQLRLGQSQPMLGLCGDSYAKGILSREEVNAACLGENTFLEVMVRAMLTYFGSCWAYMMAHAG